MHETGPEHFAGPDALAGRVIEAIGRTIVLALPLGLGKANHLANALYARAAADPSISLKIYTALTLEQPIAPTDLQRRFLGPISDRLFGGYPTLAYAEALRAGTMPANIEVHEFFLLAGRWLRIDRAQQAYISANYTHVAPMVLRAGVNVIGQLVSPRRVVDGKGQYSLSCNPDLTLDLLAARRQGRAKFLFVGQVNEELPFMGGDAAIPDSEVSQLLEGESCQFPLYAPPNQPVSLGEYAAAIHAARLVRDGGTLQIGIGAIGDALAQALILRHRDNAAFRDLAARLDNGAASAIAGEDAPFADGLYGISEMLVSSFLDLIAAGVVKREVGGHLLDAAFFLGPKSFYQRLRDMPDAERAKLGMTSVSFVNQLYGGEAERAAERVKARFFNKAMMVTMLGAVVSDGLEDGRVVSGVGGQYNFVAQAFALPDARAVIFLDATRREGGRVVSNLRWSYGRETIPMHLRDIVVTEYGVADLRGKPDSEVVKALLRIADSRFQAGLLAEAKRSGKVEAGFALPAAWRRNTPERIAEALGAARARGLLPDFPFGSDFTPVEQRLIPALQRMQIASGSYAGLAQLAFAGAMAPEPDAAGMESLRRMGLEAPGSFKERLYRALLKGALAADPAAASHQPK